MISLNLFKLLSKIKLLSAFGADAKKSLETDFIESLNAVEREDGLRFDEYGNPYIVDDLRKVE